MKYEFHQIEKKWQKVWEEKKAFAASNSSDKPKFFALVEFPYPSGDGLHVGHARPYTAMDVVARKKRMQGMNVLFPIGFDAFGLPTENYAIKHKMHPRTVTERNIKNFSSQLKMLGYSFDWDRCVDTSEPSYYRWTQWIFQQMFKKGLAYKTSMPVNWCPACKLVLANEEVVNGVHERCDTPVVKKENSQWMLGITQYAQRLLDDLDDLDYIERAKVQQRNWIGRSTGAEVEFSTTSGDKLQIFTTRCDTMFGATYMVMSPEHALIAKWLESGLLQNADEVKAYQAEAARKSDFERTEINKDKTGVALKGVAALNPATGNEIPIYLSDYVLATYGTGAIMAVPGHDQRDWEFAKVFGLPIVEVVQGGDVSQAAYTDCESGVMVNSGFLNGMTVEQAIPTMIRWLTEKGIGREKVNFKLRDWVFSRQRYWGEPIPIIHCEKCGWVPMKEEDLPLLLPEVESYEPTDTGESPLAAMEDWVACTCPQCGGPARHETDTMPNWAGSSWYFLRYMDAHNDTAAVGKDAADYWGRVDWYNGGMEHTTLHLLYSRFWHKVLYDIGVVADPEPYTKRTSHGMILGEDMQKMSKSRGNVINPNDIVNQYGADTMRLYIMFIGDFEKTAPWSSEAVKGCKRFLDRVWNLRDRVKPGDSCSKENEASIHRTIKKVGDDIDAMKFNTAIAAMMSLVNEFYDRGLNRADFKLLLSMLSPFAPHIAEELWELCSFPGLCSQTPWPAYDEAKMVEAERTIAIQVGGKLKGTVTVASDLSDEEVLQAVLAEEKIRKIMEGMELVKTIVVKNKLVNLILKPKKA